MWSLGQHVTMMAVSKRTVRSLDFIFLFVRNNHQLHMEEGGGINFASYTNTKFLYSLCKILYLHSKIIQFQQNQFLKFSDLFKTKNQY